MLPEDNKLNLIDRSAESSKIAVVLYLYHTDLFFEFFERLKPYAKNICLYLGLCKNHDNALIIKTVNQFFDCKISFHDNYGADIAPFLNQLFTIDQEYFIKLHSKRSYLGDYQHINWRSVFLNDYFNENKKVFYSNINKIKNNQIGMIANQQLILPSTSNSMHTTKIQELCNLLNINLSSKMFYNFVGGNMFMSKTQLFVKHLQNYRDKILTMLKHEKNKVTEHKGATYSHSLERIFGYFVTINKLDFDYINLDTIKIVNSQAPNGIFNLVIMYNKDCYLQEDINVYGRVIDFIPNISITIEWYHLYPKQTQAYKFLDNTTIVKNTI